MDQKGSEIECVSTMGLLLLPVAFGEQFEYSMYNKHSLFPQRSPPWGILHCGVVYLLLEVIVLRDHC